MKKVMLMLFVALLSIATISAQEFKVGVKAGFNASNVTNLPSLTLPGSTDNSNFYLPGFQVGIMAQYLLTPQFGIESGLYYSQMGFKQEYSFSGGKVSLSANPSYLQLPVTILYKFEVGPGLFLYPQAGGYLGYGLVGKRKFTNKSNISIPGINLETLVEGDYFNEHTNRFDAGLTFGLNIQYSKVVIGVGYDLGLLKVNKESIANMKDLKNANVKVTLGYFF